ncbi:MAG: integration host factor subunit beta [Gammaproteobacteria bacterium]|nr:integration host factor subunit beta [Gammaproteobacteria bacterium]
MTRSELILKIAAASESLPARDVQLAVKTMLDQMSGTLAEGGRIEIRGFGSFALRYRPPRIGRNPRTGEQVGLNGRHVPHFKPGKDLRERVDRAAAAERGD